LREKKKKLTEERELCDGCSSCEVVSWPLVVEMAVD
jgi:MinD superfamily P-loop ATPase